MLRIYKGDHHIIFSGGTDGVVAVWDVTHPMNAFSATCQTLSGAQLAAPARPVTGRGSQGGGRRKAARWQQGSEAKERSAQQQHFPDPIPDPIPDLNPDSDALPGGGLPGGDLAVGAVREEGSKQVPALMPLLTLPAAHQSGVNAMSVARVGGDGKGGEGGCVVVSGGDDEAIHVAMLRLREVPGGMVGEEGDLGVECVWRKRRESAHSSALKGSKGKYIAWAFICLFFSFSFAPSIFYVFDGHVCLWV